MKYCLNLGEVLNPYILKKFSVEEILKKAISNSCPGIDAIDRIYIGSSFCSQYFLKIINYLQPILDYCSSNDIPITLTIPIFSQKDLREAKIRIVDLIEKNNCIDEITVNDLGMLSYFQNHTKYSINLGRLFFKDPRDIRVTDYYENVIVRPATLSVIDNYGNIKGLELDQIAENLNLNKIPDEIETVSIHMPYTYMTTGNICKFASINQPDELKFRPNSNCQMECSTIHEFFVSTFRDSDKERELFRLGRTVYFLNGALGHQGRIDRYIFFPLKELALFGQEEE